MDKDIIELSKKAVEAMEKAYAPYSKFKVGAALMCKDGTVFTGCNIENGAYSPTLCAERTAFAKAVSEGKTQFSAIAVCGAIGGRLTDKECFPCGVCRQFMAEFCKSDFKIYIVTENGKLTEYTLDKLLPYSFGLEV